MRCFSSSAIFYRNFSNRVRYRLDAGEGALMCYDTFCCWSSMLTRSRTLIEQPRFLRRRQGSQGGPAHVINNRLLTSWPGLIVICADDGVAAAYRPTINSRWAGRGIDVFTKRKAFVCFISLRSRYHEMHFHCAVYRGWGSPLFYRSAFFFHIANEHQRPGIPFFFGTNSNNLVEDSRESFFFRLIRLIAVNKVYGGRR